MIPAWISAIVTVALLAIMIVQIARVEWKIQRKKRELAARVDEICSNDRTPPPRVIEIRRQTGNHAGRPR